MILFDWLTYIVDGVALVAGLAFIALPILCLFEGVRKP